MKRLLLRRLSIAPATLFAITVLIFLGTEVLPGDTAEAMLGQAATPELLAAMRERLGLDDPMVVRYVRWLGGMLTGDLGVSAANGVAVAEIVGPRFWNTVFLALYAAAVVMPLSLLLGVLSAAFPESLLDRTISVVTTFLISIPDFVIGVLLVALFAVSLHLFPAVIYQPNWGNLGVALHQMFLPVMTLLFTLLAHLTRMTRAAILDALSSGYVEMALLKGVKKQRILLRHVLPNAIGPVLSVVALGFGYLFSGVVIVEVVFNYPGLGRLLVDSVALRDLPMIQACTLIFCAFYVLFNLLADVSVVALNPRLRAAR